MKSGAGNPNQSKKGLGVAPTGKGLAGGVSKRTGQFTTTKRGTRGGTTSNTKTQENNEYVQDPKTGEQIYVKPKALMMHHSSKDKDKGDDASGSTMQKTGKDGKEPREGEEKV